MGEPKALGSLLDAMLARVGRERKDLSKTSRIGRSLARKGVRETPELARIVALESRDWEQQDLQFLIFELTDWLRKPTGEQTLRLAQAAALVELHDLGGLIGVIQVGGGKTLITRLAPLVLESTSPVLLVPASLKPKTEREFAMLDRHWQKHPDLKILSYQQLGRVSGAEILEQIQPDLIIADEVHKLKNRDAAVTRRVEFYMEEHPETMFCGLSGTITKRSVMNFHHLLKWSHGKEKMPLPAAHSEAMDWALALDEKVQGVAMSAGALKVFTPGNPNPDRNALREGYGERFRSTPGVVATRASAVDATIVGEFWKPRLPEEIRKHIDHLKHEWETPSGDVCQQAVDLWRHARELACGFYYRWDPPPPDEWMNARRSWFWYVRQVLADRTPGLDSALQVEQAVRRGDLNSGKKLETWRQLKDTFIPNKVPVWVSTEILEQVLERLEGPTLIWVEQIAVGEKLAQISKLAFFASKGFDKKKRLIDSLEGKESAILSIESNKEGRNLQAWSRNEIVSPPPSGGTWEQLMGRTHREGQEADEVYFGTALADDAIKDGMKQALRDAEYMQRTTGNAQKLLLAGLTLE